MFGPLFWRPAVVLQGILHLAKSEQNVKGLRISKNDGRRGTFEDDLERCISRGRRDTRDMFIRDVRGSGRWFPDMGCILEHQIFRFAKVILRGRRSTSYDLVSLLRDRHSTLHKWSGNIARRIGTRPSEISQNCFVFDVVNFGNWGSLVSQNCFVFDVIKFNIWGSLAEFLRFWHCQVQKLRKTRRIAALLMLPSQQLRTSRRSQSSFVFKLADRQIGR